MSTQSKIKRSSPETGINSVARTDAETEKNCDQSFQGLIIVVAVSIVILLVRIFQYGASTIVVVPICACIVLLAALLFRHKIPAQSLDIGIVATLMLVTALAMTRFGLLTPGIVAMAVLPVVAGSVRGTKPAIVVAILMLALISVFALLYVFGIVNPAVPPQDYMQQPLNWILFAFIFTAAVTWSLIVVSKQADGLRESARALKASQEEMMRESEAVVKLQRKDSVSQLSTGVAHEFNNVLAAIMSNIEIARGRSDNPDVVEDSLNAALESAEWGAELTHSLLSLTNTMALSPRQLNINEVIEQSMRWIRRAVPETIEIKTALAADIKLVNVDEASLSSALLNLIINSRDAMPYGGNILITTRNFIIAADGDKPLKEMAAGNYVELSVQDSGVGIEPSNQQHIFEPFYSTKGAGDSSGLGLSMVQRFMHQSGGFVSVTSGSITSAASHGTTFQLMFQPSHSEEINKAPSDLMNANSSQLNDARLMIVEDEPGIITSLQTMLESAGFKVRTAANGDIAWQALREHPDVDLVISDVVMSGKLQGGDLAQKIRETMKGVPVILMSGYASALTEGMHLNVCSKFLQKPIRKAILLDSIHTALESREEIIKTGKDN